jgi:hypothetical protein
MPQLFGKSANAIARATLFGGMGTVAVAVLILYGLNASPFFTRQRTPIPQPMPFSHRHHVGGLGLDCRYCHTSVETSSFAGMPSTHTCMTCHSQIWRDAPMLEPVRASFHTGTPLVWSFVSHLPDYVYFNHGIHVQKGVGCVSCHGRVDEMPLMWKARTLRMDFCLACHRSPEHFLQPRETVFDLQYRRPPEQERLGQELIRRYHIQVSRISDCYTCHR